MLARVKRWVEYKRVKTNPTNSQKYKNLHHCSSRLALHLLPPGDICEIGHWKHCRSKPPGGSLAPAWRHTRKTAPGWFYWYTAWRLVTYRQAVLLRELTLGFLKSVLSWPTPHTRAALSKNLKSRLAPLFPALTSCQTLITSCQTLIPNSKSLFSCPNHSHSHCCHTIARRS